MRHFAAELPHTPADAGLIEFEQPLTERMRTFLRLEFLYHQALFHNQEPADFSARAAVGSLLEILAILGRGDVRADTLKELERQSALLSRFKRQPGIDMARLHTLSNKVESLKSRLADVGPQFMNPLKECEFLSMIKHRSAIPGGACQFDLPDYGYWLRLPHAERAAQFERWTETLRPVCDAIAEVLWFTRETNDPAERIAQRGLYHHTLDRSEQLNLLRVLLPSDAGIFPEISAGQHRFTVRFLRWRGVENRPTQVEQNVRFLLALC
jgi:cell division protein ZapD